MKNLDRIIRESKRTAKKLGVEVNEISGFGDGVYRVEYREKPKETVVAGFTGERKEK